MMFDSNLIPQEIAFDLCKDYREKKGVQVLSECWGCIKFSNGKMEKMHFHNDPNNKGCKIVNERHEELVRVLRLRK